jgi:hypothetical protein
MSLFTSITANLTKSTPLQRSQFVVWFIKNKWYTEKQHNFQTKYWRTSPSTPLICEWYKMFKEPGSVLRQTGSVHVSTSVEDVQWITESFVFSLWKFVHRCSCELQIPYSTVLKMLNITCRLHALQALHLQTVQIMRPINCNAFAMDILEWLVENNEFLKHVVFTDYATFHVSGKVNCHNDS